MGKSKSSSSKKSAAAAAVPAAVANAAAAAGGKAGNSYVYIKDADYAWLPAELLDSDGTTATVAVPQFKDEQAIGGTRSTGKEERTIKLKDYPHGVLPLQNVDSNGVVQMYSDMVQLPYLHEVRFFFGVVCRLSFAVVIHFVLPLCDTSVCCRHLLLHTMNDGLTQSSLFSTTLSFSLFNE
jgi:hypothetical protein